jgi:WhiB family redox-sensing transcriptional regulator
VREQCLDFAIRHGEKFGIWGGLSERERRRIRRERALAAVAQLARNPRSA